jgi:hypothetical protein
MPNPEPAPPAPGLDRIEIALFVFGVFAMALLMLAFGQPLAGEMYLPVIGVWVIGGLGFIWWFHRHLAGSAPSRGYWSQPSSCTSSTGRT